MHDIVQRRFTAIYGEAPSFMVRAPGRVNLIGEHTDYNDGFVLPFAVDRAVWVAAKPRQDNLIRVYTLDFGEESVTFDTTRLQDNTLPHWTTYIRGAWWLLAEHGHDLPGIDVLIGSDLPIGGGMSSSAAISVAAIETALAAQRSMAYTQPEKALLAVDIERRFVGLPVGVMDQMASAVPVGNTALLLDCRSLETSAVPLPEAVEVVVINSMKERQLVGSPYAERREQCERAAELLGVASLRDTTMEAVQAAQAKLGELGFRRARHVISENTRTLQARIAFQQDDIVQAGALLNASHLSLKDDYEVSVAELDTLTAIARQHPACYGARIMGGGFGGCAVSLVQPEAYNTFHDHVAAHYEAATGLSPHFYPVRPTRGSHVEWL